MNIYFALITLWQHIVLGPLFGIILFKPQKKILRTSIPILRSELEVSVAGSWKVEFQNLHSAPKERSLPSLPPQRFPHPVPNGSPALILSG